MTELRDFAPLFTHERLYVLGTLERVIHSSTLQFDHIQEQKGLNLQPSVLETDALPVELCS